MADKYSATWVSHSSIGDYLKCPHRYYLNNVYKDPKTGNKIAIMQPPLALGQAVHEVLESLSVLPTTDRFKTPLLDLFEVAWEKVSGELGGFTSESVEYRYKQRGIEMLRRVQQNPGPIARKAVKIKVDLPHYWLSEEDSIILCGKIDWLEYLPEKDAVHIVDFKTGKRKEDKESLQLPIYHLLVHNCQKRDVDSASYWYLSEDDDLTSVALPDLETAHDRVLKIAKRIKLARQFEKYECPEGDSCWACKDLRAVVNGEAKKVGTNDYNQDVYILNTTDELESEIL